MIDTVVNDITAKEYSANYGELSWEFPSGLLDGASIRQGPTVFPNCGLGFWRISDA
jgi:hypothetical protein